MSSNQSPSSGTTATSVNSNNIISSSLKNKFRHCLGGISGGVVSTLVLHPLDMLKIRFSVDNGKVATDRPTYNGLRDAITSIYRLEGGRGFYKGLTPNVLGAAGSWGSYFLFYNHFKLKIQKGDTKMSLPARTHMYVAAQAGVVTLLWTNPIWVVKTRLCLQYEPTTQGNNNAYKGVIDALVRIRREGGFWALYKGFVPGLWGVTHGAIQFMLYEELKGRYNLHKKQPIDSKLETVEYIFCAALSKLVAAVLTYPYQVVRARLQEKNSVYKGAIDCVLQTCRYEGVRGLYKGMLAYMFHVVPNVTLVILIYEAIS